MITPEAQQHLNELSHASLPSLHKWHLYLPLPSEQELNHFCGPNSGN